MNHTFFDIAHMRARMCARETHTHTHTICTYTPLAGREFVYLLPRLPAQFQSSGLFVYAQHPCQKCALILVGENVSSLGKVLNSEILQPLLPAVRKECNSLATKSLGSFFSPHSPLPLIQCCQDLPI